ncbi:MAG: SpoIIE family protein phosphatase [Bacteroidales bacterium]|nr:SpoIIE family protein phosphatase [Bacteroidales bacterium]
MKKLLILILLTLLNLVEIQAKTFSQEDSSVYINEQKAIELKCDSLIIASKTLENKNELINNYNYVISKHPNLDTVEKYSKLLIDIALKEKKYLIALNAYHIKAFCRYYKYDFVEANKNYFSALQLSDSLHEDAISAKIKYAIASTYSMLGDYINSDNYFNQALKIFIANQDTAYICETYRSLVQTYIDFQLYDYANNYIQKSYILDSLSKNEKGLCFDNYFLGRILRGKYDNQNNESLLKESIELMKKGRDISIQLEDNFSTMQIDMELMFCYLKLSKHNNSLKDLYIDTAKFYHDIAKKFAIQFGTYTNSHDFELWNAYYLSQKNDYNKSTEIFESLVKQYETDSIYGQFTVDLYKLYSEHLQKCGNYKDALFYRDKEVEIIKKTYNREFLIYTAESKAQIEFDQENYKRIVEENANRQNFLIILITCIIIIVLLLGIIIKNRKVKDLYNILLDSNTEIELQRNQLYEINEQTKSSIRYAQRIQTASMPQKETLDAILGDCLLIWKPLDIVSGDFYWAQQNSNYKFVAIGDCTGHGVPGAFMSMLGISSLNDIVASIDFNMWQPSASEILEMMRNKIINSLHQKLDTDNSKDGIDMALCVIDTHNQEIHFAGAVRPLLLFRDGKYIQYKGDRMPVGISYHNDISFVNNKFKYQTDDVIYIYTDGIVDQFGYLDGVETKFTRKRLIETLNQVWELPFNKQYEYINSIFNQWSNPQITSKVSSSQVDDQLLLGFRM